MSKFKKNIVQRNKYLDDAGIKPENYGVNFTDKKDKRRRKWKKQRKIYGFDARETWNLDSSFAEWLYTRCSMYLDEAKDIVDLDYHKITYNDKEYTQREAIEKVKKWSLYYVKNKYSADQIVSERAHKSLTKACELWAILVHYMWW